MAITANDLAFFQSERMTDNDDGGGRMSGVEIVCGEENQIFDDLSDVDRAAGDVSIRKVYAAVASADDDKYLDAGVVVFEPPSDPEVDVTAFSTGDYYDERSDLADELESGVVRGAQLTNSYLWGIHIAGQKSLVIWQRLSAGFPGVNERIELVALSGGSELHSQVLWVTGVTTTEVERNDGQGIYTIRQVVLTIAEALTDDYEGTEPSRQDPNVFSALIYEMRYNPGAVPLVGIRPVAVETVIGDYVVNLDSLYSPLIPTAFAESPIADATPGGDSAALVEAGVADGVSFSTSAAVIRPGASMFLGAGVLPGSLSIDVSGSEITDVGGKLFVSGSEIGTIDYGSGVCAWNDSCPDYGSNSKTPAFQPAAEPLRVADTAAQVVTLANRGFVWVLTLSPIPAPGSLRVAYRAENAWYTLYEQGDGTLRGADSGYGTGTIDFNTGTVVVTTGALPDPESEILYAWSTPLNYTSRGGDPVSPPVMRGQVANPNLHPGTVSVAWSTYTLTDAAGDGVLSGSGGSGFVDYETGEWWVIPDTVPAMGAEFTVDYDYGDPVDLVTDAFSNPAVDANGDLNLTLSQTPTAGTVVLVVPMDVDSYVDAVGEDRETIPPPVPPDDGDEEPPDDVPPRPGPPKPDQKWVAYSRTEKWESVPAGIQLVRVEAISAQYATEAAAVAAAQTLFGATSISGVVTNRGGAITINGVSMTVLSSVHPPSGSGPHTGFDPTTSRTSTVY